MPHRSPSRQTFDRNLARDQRRRRIADRKRDRQRLPMAVRRIGPVPSGGGSKMAAIRYSLEND